MATQDSGRLRLLGDTPPPPPLRLPWASLAGSWLCWLRQACQSQPWGVAAEQRFLGWACICLGKAGVLLLPGLKSDGGCCWRDEQRDISKCPCQCPLVLWAQGLVTVSGGWQGPPPQVSIPTLVLL